MPRAVAEAVLLIGIPGSGKTTFYRERFFNTHVRLSLDLLKTRERESALLSDVHFGVAVVRSGQHECHG
jgi:hypothetical protein